MPLWSKASRGRVALRADSSGLIGSGHVTRCLTLADELSRRQFECHFICCGHPHHMAEQIRRRGHRVHVLPSVCPSCRPGGLQPEQCAAGAAAAVPGSQELDAGATRDILANLEADWLVVDHYSLESFFEARVRPFVGHVMVIDDLATRKHHCELLLDQAQGRISSDYAGLVPGYCEILCGAAYALLQPSFQEAREESLARPREPLRRILVSMGGADKDNITIMVLEALKRVNLPPGCIVTVVMGAQARWRSEVERCAADCSYPVEVRTNVENMAGLMLTTDIAVGAGGMTAWERCCLGVPSVVIITADNQRVGAEALSGLGAALVLELGPDMPRQIASSVRQLKDFANRSEMSNQAAAIVDGLGAKRVVDALTRGAH